MEFASKEELYEKLLPVFNVKKRLLSRTNYFKISSLDIWNYLIKNKWIRANNLTISEVVNDIITIEPDKILRDMEENNEQE